MFGFCACWAAAGIFAVAVTAQLTARTLQIFLNMPIMASSNVGCQSEGRSVRPCAQWPTARSAFPTIALLPANGRPDASATADRRRRFDEVLCVRYALSAD